jgi:predicted DNA-binding transcriptional regulator AlpA
MSDERKPLTKEQIAGRVALRPHEFAEAVGICRASVYNLMKAGKIKTVKNGKSHHAARFITTTPAEFMASLESDV